MEYFTGIHGKISSVYYSYLTIINSFAANFVVHTSLVVNKTSVDTADLIDNNIKTGQFGDIMVTYYNSRSELETGYICDSQWGQDDADLFCSKHW